MEMIVLSWFALSVLIGVAASRIGRSGVLWTITALILSPLLGGIALIVVSIPTATAKVPNKIVALSEHPLMNRPCPVCAESIRLEATKCKHCGATIDEETFPGEHNFTIKCQSCSKENEISRKTIHNFPYCSGCGEMIVDPKSINHREKLLAYITKNRSNIHDVVFRKIKLILDTLG